MRLLIILLLVSAGFTGLMGQNTKSFPKGSNTTLILFFDEADAVITGIAGNEIKVEATDYTPPPERARGLRPLYNNATDNTGIGLMQSAEGGAMTIRQASSGSGSYRISVPASMNVHFTESTWMGGDAVEISGINGEIEVETKNSDIILKNVKGPVTANTTSGDIDVIFSTVATTGPTTITNISGYIDITMPASTKADMELNNITGEVFTDLDLKLPESKDGLKRVGGQREIRSQLNGGGVDMTLKNISGDIYLRKK